MPIASHKPTTQPVSVQQPQIQPIQYKSTIVDDNVIPVSSLISFIEGAPWTVTYYSQNVGKHSDLKALDVGQNPTYQTYTKIHQLELRTTSDLKSSQDPETNVMTVNGSAYCYPFMVPNIEDVFTAEIGNGSLALFRIRSVERTTYKRSSVFVIEYDMVAYVDNEPTRMTDLEDKVSATYYFHRDRLVEGLNPNVLSTDHEQLLSLNDLYKTLVGFYFRTFYSAEYGTLILPEQDWIIYDPYLTKFVLKFVMTLDAPEIRLVRLPASGSDVYSKQPNIWDVLLSRDYSQLPLVQQHYGLISSALIAKDPVLMSLRYSGVQYVVYPSTPDMTSQSGDFKTPKVISDTVVKVAPYSSALLSDFLNTAIQAVPTLTKINVSTGYIFSTGFYTGGVCSNELEVLLRQYLSVKALDKEMLLRVADKILTAPRINQFYYIPAILMLIRAELGW